MKIQDWRGGMLVTMVALLATLGLTGTASWAQPEKKSEPPAAPGAQPEAQPAVEPTTAPPIAPVGPAAKLEMERMVQDWGLVSDIEKLHAQIKFKNTGDAPLIFSEIRPSCSCVRPKALSIKAGGAPNKPEASVAKMEFAPGEEGILDIGFEPIKKRSRVEYWITIKCNDPLMPVRKVKVTCDVKPTVWFDPKEGLSFGELEHGVAKTLHYTMSGRAPDFKASYATVSGNVGLKVKVGQTKEVTIEGEKVRQTDIEVTVPADAAFGRFSESIFVRHNDSRIESPITVLVTGEVMSDLLPEAPSFDLGTLGQSQTIKQEFKVVNVKGAAFKIADSRWKPVKQASNFPAPKISVTYNDKGDVATVLVESPVPVHPGSYEAEVQLLSDIKGMTAVRVPFRFTVRDGV